MPESISPSDDYISFSSIKNIFLDILQFIFKVFNFLISSVRRELGLFLLCCVLGLVGGYIYYIQSPRYFKAEMIVQHNELNRKAFYEIIKSLNDLISTQSYSNFAGQLKIDKALGRQVLYVEALGMNNESLVSDTSTKIKVPFKIQVKMSDNTSAPVLQNALLSYLNNNSYLRLTKEGQRRIYADRLQFIEREQSRLDSLKDNYNTALASMRLPATFYNNALNPAELYEHSLNLADEKEKVLKWMNNESEAITLIDGFKVSANPQSFSLKLFLLVGLASGILLGLIVAFLSAVKKMV
jgi:hypothetical protein